MQGEAGGGPRAGRRLHVAGACRGACKRAGEVVAGIIHRYVWAVDGRARGGRCPRRWVGPRYICEDPHAASARSGDEHGRFPCSRALPFDATAQNKSSRDHSRAPARRTLLHSSPQPAATADANARSSGESCTRSRLTIRAQIGRAVRYGLRASCSSVGPPLRPTPRAAAPPPRRRAALSVLHRTSAGHAWTCACVERRRA